MQHHQTLQSHWYYQHTKIEAIWQNSFDLVYKAELPFFTSDDLIHYHIKYFVFPLGTNMLRVVQRRENIVINTITGHSFTPNNEQCLGYRPMACRPTLEELQESCESGLIAGKRSPACTVQLSERGNDTLFVYREDVADQEIIVVAYTASDLTLRCLGQASRQYHLEGIRKLILQDNCTLESEYWRISGIARGMHHVNIRFQNHLELPSINISWPTEFRPEFLARFHYEKRANVNLGELPTLQLPQKTQGRWRHSNFGYIFGSVIIIAVVMIVIWVYYRKLRKPSAPLQPTTPTSVGEGKQATYVFTANKATADKAATQPKTEGDEASKLFLEPETKINKNPYAAAQSLLQSWPNEKNG